MAGNHNRSSHFPFTTNKHELVDVTLDLHQSTVGLAKGPLEYVLTSACCSFVAEMRARTPSLSPSLFLLPPSLLLSLSPSLPLASLCLSLSSVSVDDVEGVLSAEGEVVHPRARDHTVLLLTEGHHLTPPLRHRRRRAQLHRVPAQDNHTEQFILMASNKPS